MTKNNKKMTSSSKLVMFVIIPAILVLAVGVNVPTASATHCEGSTNCYAYNYFPEDKSGIKFDGKVSNMSPSCAPGSTDEPTVTSWVLFPNDWFIENGFTSGHLAGSCYTAEKSYWGYGYSTPVEYNTGTVTVGTTYTFSMDDINADKYWTVKRDSTTLASGVWMGSTTYLEARVGMEGNISNPGSSWIPETELRNVEEYDNGWQSPSQIGSWEPDTQYDYYMDQCTSAEDLNVGTTSGVSC